ncbi:hypothetical protein GH714_033510 [Hevea brasiliensis]|uniref:Leucine-rich repeat-containing N-terminal plant-type domain-containing protein n=1 Tax=Hevea brasiliensis TaxID=3981 RepID=A0A6A6KDA5_HEVBR|nr:hypothetical protein GH714_033510 [Hevea brasiliensis]
MENIKLCLSDGNLNVNCIDTEREALLDFKKGLTDPSDRLSSWEGNDCCKWNGIICNNQTGHVTILNLRNPYPLINGGVGDQAAYERSCLGGKISPSLSRLEYLTHLDMSFNDFRGAQIPDYLGFKKLRYLNLSFSSFAGDIPSQLGNLSSLLYLDLYADSYSNTGSWELHADDLHWLSGLSSLKYLNLGLVKLKGVGADWLQAVNMLPSLVEIHLHYCELEGLPYSLPSINFTSLSVLDLSDNSFNSKIPQWLFNLTALTKVYLVWNFFNGSIPTEFSRLKSLEVLDLSNNLDLGGQIPSIFGNLRKLKILDLSANGLTGEIHEFLGGFSENPSNSLVSLLKSIQLENCLVGPFFPMWLQVQNELTSVTLRKVGISDTIPEEWFSKLSPQITHMVLSNNQIKGNLPNQLKTPNLRFIDLSSNRFGGPLPLWSANATELYLQGNLFSGSIPENIGGLMPRLEKLYAFSNHLTGRIPSSLCDIGGLQVLSLRNNQISGELPNCWHQLMFWAIDVSNNTLTGQIPSSFGLLSSLSVLLLSNNNLDGEIPSSLQNCSGLTSIDLRGNKLSGSLPSWIGERLSSLFMLQLLSNSLRGPIPQQLCHPPKLHILDLSGNRFSGDIPNCIGNLTVLVSAVNGIDLSGNNLTGGIPDEVTNLVALRTLNLSRNQLSGNITKKIGDLQNLETLDLSHNHLSGSIPVSLASLNSLVHLNLSYNNLEGKIPAGLQKFNDPSVFMGNPSLCGVPLPNKCPGGDRIL